MAERPIDRRSARPPGVHARCPPAAREVVSPPAARSVPASCRRTTKTIIAPVLLSTRAVGMAGTGAWAIMTSSQAPPRPRAGVYRCAPPVDHARPRAAPPSRPQASGSSRRAAALDGPRPERESRSAGRCGQAATGLARGSTLATGGAAPRALGRRRVRPGHSAAGRARRPTAPRACGRRRFNRASQRLALRGGSTARCGHTIRGTARSRPPRGGAWPC
jgi:hypothetical protein